MANSDLSNKPVYLFFGPFPFVARVDDDVFAHVFYRVVECPNDNAVTVAAASFFEETNPIFQLLCPIYDKTVNYN